MRRAPAAVAVVVAGLALAPPAHAGILSALSALSKVARVAGSAGKAAKLTKLAKGSAILKGAGKLTAVVAAERVFAHAARSGSRVPLYVTKADDGLRVVMGSGDELAHTRDSLGALTRDLDTMAAGSAEAGVDVFLDASVAGELGDLAVGPHTRVWLANLDGPSLPLRAGTVPGTTEVAVARNTWVRFGTDVGDAALQVATSVPDVTVTVSGPCGASPDEALAEADAGDTVLLLSHLDEPAWAAWRADALDRGIDLVVLGLDEVCDGVQPSEQAHTLAEAATRAPTTGDLWTLLDGPAPSLHLGDAALHLTAGDTTWAVHPAGSTSAEIPLEVDDETAFAIGLTAIVLLLVGVGVRLVRAVRPSREAS